MFNNYQAELTGTKDQVRHEQAKSSDLAKERAATKRRLERYDDMKKKHKAEHERAVYWQRKAEENRVEAAASVTIKEVEKQNCWLQQEVEALEGQKEDFRLKLADALTDKVSVCVIACTESG